MRNEHLPQPYKSTHHHDARAHGATGLFNTFAAMTAPCSVNA
jgi:hypothetical protein